MHDAAELRAVAHNEALSAEERDVAAKLLETLEAPKPKSAPVSISEMLATVFADIDAKAAAYRLIRTPASACALHAAASKRRTTINVSCATKQAHGSHLQRAANVFA